MEFITFDTDYMPRLSNIPIKEGNGKDSEFVILEFNTTESGDPNTTIIPKEQLETEQFKNLIEAGMCRIIGGGVCTKSISELMYGLQHTTRIMYKHTIQEAFKKFTTDDIFIRESFNGISDEVAE